MGELQMTRRAALAALAMAAASAVATRRAAAQESGLRFREIRVDVSQMREKDQDEAADWVAAALPGYLKQSFAKYLAPGDRHAAVLVAKVDDVTLGSPNERPMFMSMSNDTVDQIDGAGVVLDASGRVLNTYPLFATIDADTQQRQAYQYQAAINRRRVEMLARGFAQWLPGKMGL
jgi:hypothetical protein